jgi:hypothetical protein
MYKVGPEGLPSLKSFLLHLKAIKENELSMIHADTNIINKLGQI